MVETNIVLTLLQTVSIMVGITYYILNIENNRKNQELTRIAQENALHTRQAQLFMQIYNRFQDPEFAKMWTKSVLLKDI